MAHHLSKQSSFSTLMSSYSSSVTSQSTDMTSYSSPSSSRKLFSSTRTSPSPLSTVSLPSRATPRTTPATPLPLSTSLLDRLARLQGLESEAPGEADKHRAYELMQLHRTASGKDMAWTRPPNSKDATAVLEGISLGLLSATPALVVALIKEFNANVCIARPKSNSFIKIVQDKDQIETRSTLLAQATQHCSDEIVYVLTYYADIVAASEALPVAITQKESLKVMMLMAKGADASGLCELFLQAVESGPDDLVEALLKDGNQGACQKCRNVGMVRAAIFRYEKKALLLLKRGADVTYDNSSALLAASRRGMQHLATQMLSSAVGSRRLDVTFLDRLVGDSYALGQLQLVEACLTMGAKGRVTNRVLAEAVRTQQEALVDLFALHGADLSHDGGLSVRLAVRGESPQLLSTLLRRGQATISRGVIGAAVAEAMKCSTHEVAMDMTELLLAANIFRDPVNDALTLSVYASATLGDDTCRAALTHLLITKGQANPNANGGWCFVMAVKNGWPETVRQLLHYRTPLRALNNAMRDVMAQRNPQLRMNLLACLIEHVKHTQEADVNTKLALMNAALQAAAGAFLVDAAQYVMSSFRRFTEIDLVTAWETATSPDRGDRWLSPEGLCMLHFLLEQGVSGPCIADSFIKAVTMCHREATWLLYPFVKSEATLSRALHSLSAESTSWCLEENLWLVSALLAGGCDSHSVNSALIAAVKACSQGAGSETVVDVILTDSDKADINFQHGEALKLAIRAGNAPLLSMLLSSGNAHRAVLTQAFATLITSHLNENTMINLLDQLQGDDHQGNTPRFDANLSFRNGLTSLAACLDVNPDHSELMRRLIQLGCHIDVEFHADLCQENNVGEEASTVLLWSCKSRGQRSVSSAVIEVLIAANANVNFTAPVSQLTPLILASRCRRGDVVAKLIAAKAIPTARDCFESTALFYASRAGDLALVNQLKGISLTNDGSLHEASRNLHSHVVRALLEAKHSVYFPVQGITALQDLCLHADGSQNYTALEDTTQALYEVRCDIWATYGGRDALFLALDNLHSPVQVTAALLRVFMRDRINDERNIFKTGPAADGTKMVYSPTVYLESRYFRGKREKIPELRELLYSLQAMDRYYMDFGVGAPNAIQPSGAVNMPAWIEEEDKRRQALRQYQQRLHVTDYGNQSQRSRGEMRLGINNDTRTHHQQEHRAEDYHLHMHVQAQELPADEIKTDRRQYIQHGQQLSIKNQKKPIQQGAASDLQAKVLPRRQAVMVSMHRDKETGRMNVKYIDAKPGQMNYHRQTEEQQDADPQVEHRIW